MFKGVRKTPLVILEAVWGSYVTEKYRKKRQNSFLSIDCVLLAGKVLPTAILYPAIIPGRTRRNAPAMYAADLQRLTEDDPLLLEGDQFAQMADTQLRPLQRKNGSAAFSGRRGRIGVPM